MNTATKIVSAGAVIAVIGAIAGVYINVLSGGGVIAGADADDAGLVARGALLYADNCAACHGANLQGQANWRSKGADGRFGAPPHDQTGHTWHHPDANLFAVTKQGGQANAPAGFVSGMPPYADILTDGEIWAVLAYIKSSWPAEIRKRQARMNAQAGG